MKTTKIDLQKLQNEEHFQFNTEFKDLVQKAKFFSMPALAITDHGNLYGIMDFYKTCKN